MDMITMNRELGARLAAESADKIQAERERDELRAQVGQVDGIYLRLCGALSWCAIDPPHASLEMVSKAVDALITQRDESRDRAASLREERDRLLDILRAIVGHGYTENRSQLASQDYVSKSAIAKVRAALTRSKQT